MASTLTTYSTSNRMADRQGVYDMVQSSADEISARADEETMTTEDAVGHIQSVKSQRKAAGEAFNAVIR